MTEEPEKETYLGDVESYEGEVPLWLIMLYVVLTVWGVYYLVRYWNEF